MKTYRFTLTFRAEVLAWFDRETEVRPRAELFELANVTSAMAISLQAERSRDAGGRD
jgi:hypothetical protein